MSLWLDDDLAKLVDLARKKEGQDRSTFVRQAIVDHLRQLGVSLPDTAAAPARSREALPVEAEAERLIAEAEAEADAILGKKSASGGSARRKSA